jgi:hypothetical protein
MKKPPAFTGGLMWSGYPGHVVKDGLAQHCTLSPTQPLGQAKNPAQPFWHGSSAWPGLRGRGDRSRGGHLAGQHQCGPGRAVPGATPASSPGSQGLQMATAASGEDAVTLASMLGLEPHVLPSAVRALQLPIGVQVDLQDGLCNASRGPRKPSGPVGLDRGAGRSGSLSSPWYSRRYNRSLVILLQQGCPGAGPCQRPRPQLLTRHTIRRPLVRPRKSRARLTRTKASKQSMNVIGGTSWSDEN